MNIEDSVIILKNIKKLVAIEWKHYITDTELSAIETLLTAYEKQQKEIEELKDKYSDEKIRNTIIKRYRQVIEKDYVSKDKIKAKIEEINKEMLNEENSLELFYRKKYCKEVLQSLLEKE